MVLATLSLIQVANHNIVFTISFIFKLQKALELSITILKSALVLLNSPFDTISQ